MGRNCCSMVLQSLSPHSLCSVSCLRCMMPAMWHCLIVKVRGAAWQMHNLQVAHLLQKYKHNFSRPGHFIILNEVQRGKLIKAVSAAGHASRI